MPLMPLSFQPEKGFALKIFRSPKRESGERLWKPPDRLIHIVLPLPIYIYILYLYDLYIHIYIANPKMHPYPVSEVYYPILKGTNFQSVEHNSSHPMYYQSNINPKCSTDVIGCGKLRAAALDAPRRSPSEHMKPQSVIQAESQLCLSYPFHASFSAHLEWNTEVVVLASACEEHIEEKYALHQFPCHFAFFGSELSQWDPLHTLSPGVCTSCLSWDKTNEAAMWWPTSSLATHRTEQYRYSTTRYTPENQHFEPENDDFQCRNLLVMRGLHKTETLSWRPRNWRC